MKQLQKSDLKEGEIYKQLSYNYIFLYNKNETSDSFNDGIAISTTAPRYCKKWTANRFEKDMFEATEEEKHWLRTCIKADKFVSYEEAMKTFVQYYKIIESKIAMNYNNIIHEESIVFGHYNGNNRIIKAIETDKHRVFSTTDVLYGEIGDQKVCFDMLALEPSTKEAYDAQFVVKEPEFVLPEKWWVRITKENLKDISKFLNANIGEHTIGFVAGMVKSYKTGKITKGYNSTPTTSYGSTFGNEITLEQFKKYVLKENTIVTEKPKVVLEEPKDKVLVHLNQSNITLIHSVECSEGGVYKIGDKIKVFTHNSPNKGKVFTIKGFRWNNAKNNLCAVTELHTPNGIGLNKIELYIEPKVKIVDDFILPEKWCVKHHKIVAEYIMDMKKINHGYSQDLRLFSHFPSPDTNLHCYSKICTGYTEITFEQFKKYVLKNE